jgi:hypothetical protein
MALTTDLSLRLLATLTNPIDLVTGSAPLDYQQRIQLATGTGAAGLADVAFSDTRTIAPSSNDDLDLVGSLTNVYGATFSPARIKMLLVVAAAANANNVVVGAAAATQWAALLGTTGTVTLRPGAFFMAAAGAADATAYVCAGGATDLLRIANSGAGTSVNYDIVVIGAST